MKSTLPIRANVVCKFHGARVIGRVGQLLASSGRGKGERGAGLCRYLNIVEVESHLPTNTYFSPTMPDKELPQSKLWFHARSLFPLAPRYNRTYPESAERAQLEQRKQQTVTGAMNHRIVIDASGYHTTLDVHWLV